MPTIATGLKISIANTPQAKDDVAGGLEDFSALLDVLLNDLGGTAKTLYSLSKYLTVEDGGTETAASMISGVPVQTITTDLGSTATIVNGMISYATNGLDYLGEGEEAIDQFSYVIRLSNGAFSIAVVSVTLTGSNDAPVITVVGTDSASAPIDETNAGLTATGTLTVSDPDTTDTVDVAVTGLVVSGDGGTGGLSNDDLLAMLSLSGNVDNAADGTQGSLQWDFDSGSEAFDYLAAGEVLVLTYTLTATDDAPLTPLSDTQTVTITITGTNDAPVLIVDASGSVAEDAAVIGGMLIDSGALSFTDVDVTDTHLVTTGVTSVVWSGGSLSPAVQAALTAGFSADADGWDYSVANSAVQFLDDGETLTLTLTVTVTDDSGAANDSDTETVTITIAGTNDAPELTGSVSSLADGLEDNGYTVTQAQLLAGWTDVDGETLSITGLTATNGTVVANGDGSYTITPSANYYGPVTLDYSVSDGTAPMAASLSYTLAPVNDAPAGADNTLTVLEDGSHAFSAADFGFGDPVESDDLAAVLITTLPAAGSLKLNGVAVSVGQSVSAADIAAGLLVYAPAANANGAGYASFTFQVQDDGGTANGGQDTDQSPNSISIDVTPVNDAPELTGTAASLPNGTEDNSYTVTQAQLLEGWTDLDGDTLSITGLATSNGTVVQNVDGSFTITPTADFYGPVTLNYNVSDGTAAVATSLGFTIDDVPDDVLAPTDIRFTLASTASAFTASLTAGGTLGSFTAVDGDSATWSFTLGGTNASLFTLSPTSGGSVGLLVGAANIDIGNYSFTVTATDAGGNNYVETYTLSVGSSNGATGDTTAAFTITAGTDIDFGINGPDSISGGAGDDALAGGNQSDNLFGGLGNDQLLGGAQSDNFIFNTALDATNNVDVVMDFNAANADKIHLENAVFTQLAATGTLAAANFVSNVGGNAVDANDYVLYDSATGNLYYDTDGSGAGAKVLFATISLAGAGGTVDAGDFIVI